MYGHPGALYEVIPELIANDSARLASAQRAARHAGKLAAALNPDHSAVGSHEPKPYNT